MIRIIQESIIQKPWNIIAFLFCTLLYLLNEYYIKLYSQGILYYISICYLNDVLASVLFLSYTNIILWTNKRELKTLDSIVTVCIGTGVIWEYGARYLKDNSTVDMYDFVAYILGGIVYWHLNRVCSKITSEKGMRTEK